MRGGGGGIAMSASQHSSLFGRNSPHGAITNAGQAAPISDSSKKEFPAGLRVLVVDDDPICLLILEKMLRRCAYDVTTCNQATTALAMLRENKSGFDLVISDVYMPDMDGFKLLELVGLEMDLPVIMMSADGETSNVMKGITHGACDYLLKPVRMEELRNIWQHVWRKKRNEAKEVEHSNSVEDTDRIRRPFEDAEFTSSSNNNKRKDVNEEEDDNEHEIDDSTTLKKPRVVWSVELHQQFVSAVNKLGIDKAVPKRILEIMNVQGLTRENVASHLQKYRLYLKRLSSGPQSTSMNLSFAGSQDASLVNTLSSLEGIYGLQSLAASGHLTAQALASVHSSGIGSLGNVSGIGPTAVDPSVLLQLAALQGGSGCSFTKPRVAAPVIKQGSLYQPLPGGLEIDQVSCTQNVSVVNPLEPLREHASGANNLQHQLVSDGVGGIRSLGGSCENLSTGVSGNMMLMHFLQQQQAKQQADGGSILQGQKIRPADFSAHLGSFPSTRTSSLNNEVGFSAINGGIAPAVSYGLNNLYGTSHVDSSNLSLLSIPGSGHPAGSCTKGTGMTSSNVANTPTMKNFATAGIFNESFGSQPIRSTVMPFNTLGRVNNSVFQDANQVKRVVPLGQTMGVMQDFVATPNPLQSSCNNQGLANPHLHAMFHQDQVQNHELMAQGLNLTSNSDDGFMRPRGSQCNSEQSNVNVNLKLKKEPMPDSAATKLENTLSAMEAASPDDLLTLLWKQQREMASYGGSDLVLDRFSADHMK